MSPRPIYLIQVLIPIHDNRRTPFPRQRFERVRQELTDRFGGVTVFLRSPAIGFWKDEEAVVRDDVVLYEVMTETLDRDWWTRYRLQLQERFAQQEMVIRSSEIERL